MSSDVRPACRRFRSALRQVVEVRPDHGRSSSRSSPSPVGSATTAGRAEDQVDSAAMRSVEEGHEVFADLLGKEADDDARTLDLAPVSVMLSEPACSVACCDGAPHDVPKTSAMPNEKTSHTEPAAPRAIRDPPSWKSDRLRDDHHPHGTRKPSAMGSPSRRTLHLLLAQHATWLGKGQRSGPIYARSSKRAQGLRGERKLHERTSRTHLDRQGVARLRTEQAPLVGDWHGESTGPYADRTRADSSSLARLEKRTPARWPRASRRSSPCPGRHRRTSSRGRNGRLVPEGCARAWS